MPAPQPTTLALPLASYQLTDLRASSKRLVGCYPETTPSDNANDPTDEKDAQVATLRRWPGITLFAATPIPTGASVRGFWELAGVQYVVIGPSLYSLNASGLFTFIGTGLPGNGIVRMTDNGACLVVLVPGTDICYTYTPFAGGGGWQQLTSTFFINFGGAIDCWFIDTFIVFLANNNGGNGSYTFFNDDGRQVSGNAQITFTTAASFTRQFGTDPFYGLIIDHREIIAFGARTTEGFVNTGNAVGTPFSTAADTFMPYGMHPAAAFTVALQDNSVFWVANDLTVRRRNGQTPVRVSNAGIEGLLQEANRNGLLSGCYAFAPTWNGHPFYVLIIPQMERSVVYDCITQQWFDLVSVVNGEETYWRAQCWYNGLGKQLIGDALSGNVGYLDETSQSEFGLSPVVYAFTMEPIYTKNERIVTRRLECVITAGAGAVPGYAPQIDLLLSDDWGQTFYAADGSQTLGEPGDIANRSVWWNLGQHRSLVPQFRVTDASITFTVDVHADIEPGKY